MERRYCLLSLVTLSFQTVRRYMGVVEPLTIQFFIKTLDKKAKLLTDERLLSYAYKTFREVEHFETGEKRRR